MLNRLFPKEIDNSFRGHWLAIWILVPVVLLKLAMAVNVMGLDPLISNIDVLKEADAVPIDTFGGEAASTVVFLFASWGLGLLLLSLLGIVVLIRYRAMIPLMFLLLLIEQIGRKAILLVNPIVSSTSPEGISTGTLINWGFTAALALGFVLSLQNRAAKKKAASSV